MYNFLHERDTSLTILTLTVCLQTILFKQKVGESIAEKLLKHL